MRNRVREHLEARGQTQRWLSEASGVNEDQISRICNGSGCSIRNAQRIARALDTTVENLFPLDEAA